MKIEDQLNGAKLLFFIKKVNGMSKCAETEKNKNQLFIICHSEIRPVARDDQILFYLLSHLSLVLGLYPLLLSTPHLLQLSSGWHGTKNNGIFQVYFFRNNVDMTPDAILPLQRPANFCKEP